ncbi:hypothetical protein FRC17_002254 [Serendipita sp. 399]|nr:hypothetical protein FRC17_002254 [Serendipita sp. 399]
MRGVREQGGVCGVAWLQLITPSEAWRQVTIAPDCSLGMEMTTSTRFPTGYGDFQLQSSDGVICHFPKSVLSYTSGFFRGMLQLPIREDSSSPQMTSYPLIVTERAEILEAFLDLIDPNTVAPQLNAQTVRDILEAARKYDVPVIFLWFQREVKLRYHDVDSRQTTESFLLSNPLMTFSIAVEYSLEEVGKMAIAELLGCPSEHLDTTIAGVPIEALNRIRRARKERIKTYIGWTQKLAKGDPVHVPIGMRSMVVGFGQAKTCLDCLPLRIDWALWLIMKVQDSPRWSTLQECIEQPVTCKPATCSVHQSDWSTYVRKIQPKIKGAIESQEEREAVWPF